MSYLKLAVVGSRFVAKSKKNAEEVERMKVAAEYAKAALVKILDRFYDKYKPVWFISGGAIGVDSWGEEWSKTKSMSRQIFEPVWYPNGRDKPMDKGAGFKRNRDIIETADFVIALTNGSNGTANSIDWAKKLNKPLVVFAADGKLVEKVNIPDENNSNQ